MPHTLLVSCSKKNVLSSLGYQMPQLPCPKNKWRKSNYYYPVNQFHWSTVKEIIKTFNYYNLSYEDDGNNSEKLFAHF